MADMTDEQAHELGRAWIEAGGGWARRMQSIGRHDGYDEDEDGGEGSTMFDRWTVSWDLRGWWRVGPCGVGAPKDNPEYVPDLRDPATRGAALQVVRERWGDILAWLEPQDYEAKGASLYAHIGGVQRYWWGPTEAHALVAAIREAP